MYISEDTKDVDKVVLVGHGTWCLPTLLLQRDTLAEESRYRYTHTQYEADDKSYQNDND